MDRKVYDEIVGKAKSVLGIPENYTHEDVEKQMMDAAYTILKRCKSDADVKAHVATAWVIGLVNLGIIKGEEDKRIAGKLAMCAFDAYRNCLEILDRIAKKESDE